MEVDAYNALKNQKATKDQYQRWRKRIKDQRFSMVGQLFKTNIQLCNIVEQKECGSDIEEGGRNTAPISLIPDWRSNDLTAILHCLDKMNMARGVHHKTIAANEKLYTRSKRNFQSNKGIVGVPRGLPLDAYSKLYWSKLSPFERDTISKVPAIGLDVIAKNLQQICNRGTSAAGSTSSVLNPNTTSNSGTSGHSQQGTGGSCMWIPDHLLGRQ
ncbi:hypothetical protein PTTG_29750 [Puccinia triticina 1-1 BBBD Race 1]|uniref:Uncharacterized protein n=1 Tax=Puccinia triticina (isolate 1-1 / race 1 (BBBD)) TaxID=630390 RepID=A0A180G203_PUCT1|nr:hypothetical protein PTTG_29750 [Puccinia triticina 1-1 BBBD Race 1]